MVGSVNRVSAPLAPLRPAGHKPTRPDLTGGSNEPGHEAEPDADAARGAPPERPGYAERARIGSVLINLAAARTGARDLAGSALQAAARKLQRLKAEALAAAASGDRKAAARIGEDLAQLAREIADAARDYAAAGGEAALTAVALADAAAAIDVGAAPDRDAGGSDMPPVPASGFADALSTAMDQHAAAAAGDPGAASPPPTADASDPPRSLPEDAPYPGALLRHEPDDRAGAGVQADAHAMLDEALALKRAMRRVMARPSAEPARIDPTLQTDSAASGARPGGLWPRVV